MMRLSISKRRRWRRSRRRRGRKKKKRKGGKREVSARWNSLSSQMILEARHRVTNRQLMSSAGSG
jgi:hypothetical protein